LSRPKPTRVAEPIEEEEEIVHGSNIDIRYGTLITFTSWTNISVFIFLKINNAITKIKFCKS